MCNSANCTHLNDDLSDLFGAPSADVAQADAFARAALSSATSTVTYEEKCADCRGTGSFYSYTGRYVGQCFKCKGAGVRRYKTSAEQRAKARDAADAKRKSAAQAAADSAAAWQAANPAEAKWMHTAAARGFEFAASMIEALLKYGHLTEKQEAAVRNATAKSIAREAQWAADRAARDANAAVVEIDRIAAAFASAKAAGLAWPKLRLADFTFSPAGESSKNAGSIYVKQDDLYLGKVTDGRFTRSRDCTDAQEAAIVAACADPHAAAVAYGKETGVCACCGRKLTNAESVELGIGPICRDKWGWA